MKKISNVQVNGLLKVRLCYVNVKEGPEGLEPNAWTRNKIKVTVKETCNCRFYP